MSSSTVAERILFNTDTFVLYISILYLISGLFGHCLNLILFSTLRSLRTKSCGYIFFLESIINLCRMSIELISYILQYEFNINAITNSIIWCKIKTTAIQAFHFIFISLICFAAFDQFLSTHHSYQIRRLSTKNFLRKLIIGSLSLMIVHVIISLVFFEIRVPLLACVIYESIIANYYIFFYYPVLIGLLPITISVAFSLFAFYNVRHLVRRQIPIYRRQIDHQLTAMTFSRVIVAICLSLPYTIFRIYSVNKSFPTNHSMSFAINYMIGSITGALSYGNCVISFYVFVLSSTRFRRQIKHLVRRKCCRSANRSHRRIEPIIIQNQTCDDSSQQNVSTIKLT